MVKVLVTGGAGFIGSHVVDALVVAGYEVYVIDNFSTGRRDNLNSGAHTIQGDITCAQTFDELPRVSYVFHLAALARIQPSIKDPITSHQANVDGTLNVLEYCRRVGAKLIFSSSSSVYAGDELPANEQSPTHPKSPYSLQKLICEQYATLYGELYGMGYVTLRYFNVYGERQILSGAYAAVVGIFLDQKANGNPLTITGDGSQQRDFTYVGDIAKGNVMAMDWPDGVYNLGAGCNYSINKIASLVGGDRNYVAARSGEVRATLADSTKAMSRGWKAETAIEDWVSAQ